MGAARKSILQVAALLLSPPRDPLSRKTEVYNMGWYNAEDPDHLGNIEFEGYFVAVGPFGGPIGTLSLE